MKFKKCQDFILRRHYGHWNSIVNKFEIVFFLSIYSDANIDLNAIDNHDTDNKVFIFCTWIYGVILFIFSISCRLYIPMFSVFIIWGNTQNMNSSTFKKSKWERKRCKFCSLNRIGLSTICVLHTIWMAACR